MTMTPSTTTSGRADVQRGESRLLAVKTVLVADDTDFVRDRFRKALEAGGHKAITARTGPEFPSACRQRHDDLDLIVLDLRLPQGTAWPWSAVCGKSRRSGRPCSYSAERSRQPTKCAR